MFHGFWGPLGRWLNHKILWMFSTWIGEMNMLNKGLEYLPTFAGAKTPFFVDKLPASTGDSPDFSHQQYMNHHLPLLGHTQPINNGIFAISTHNNGIQV